MKVILVYVGEILHCPPVLSLIGVLNDLGIKVIVCLTDFESIKIEDRYKNLENVEFIYLNINYEKKVSKVKKFFRMFYIRKKIWKLIDEHYDDQTILWVVSGLALKHLGAKIMKYRYILHLLELIEELYYLPYSRFINMNVEKYAKKAKILVEAEYNRAHITMAWWKLEKLPKIFPNKPYKSIDIPKKSDITSSEKTKKLMLKLKGKKIILYQGNISKERPLREYVHAVEELGDEYAFVMMINGENPYPELKAKNFYCIPFIEPPYHLEITSNAYIGVLSYTPIKNNYSILNTLYCAPNKVWEYSKYGIPMIGNDLPALKQVFDKFHIGICVDDINRKEIKKAILSINHEYIKYTEYSMQYFNSVDLKAIVEKILKEANFQ